MPAINVETHNTDDMPVVCIAPDGTVHVFGAVAFLVGASAESFMEDHLDACECCGSHTGVEEVMVPDMADPEEYFLVEFRCPDCRPMVRDCPCPVDVRP